MPKDRRYLGATIDRLLDRYEQEEFRRAVHERFRRLRDDPAAWADYKQEVAAWDAILMDGLEDEPPFDDSVDASER